MQSCAACRWPRKSPFPGPQTAPQSPPTSSLTPKLSQQTSPPPKLPSKSPHSSPRAGAGAATAAPPIPPPHSQVSAPQIFKVFHTLKPLPIPCLLGSSQIFCLPSSHRAAPPAAEQPSGQVREGHPKFGVGFPPLQRGVPKTSQPSFAAACPHWSPPGPAAPQDGR